MATDLETGLLRAFATAARAGSISRAAAALGHTQPSLSQRLQKLERAVGQRLLHRTASGVVLTRAGEALLPYAERILALSAQARTVTGQVLAGRCGVGLIEDLTAAPLPQALADFAHANPGSTLELVSVPGPAMRRAFDTGRIQLALVDPTYLPEPPRWTVRLPLAWSAAPGVDLTRDPLPLVLFSPPCRWRAPVLDVLRAHGRAWRVAFESTSLAGVQAAVRAGLGAAALLATNVAPGTVAPGLPALPEVELGLVRGAATDGDPLVDAVEELLRRLTAVPG
ncbi:LysR family transcriptional regulator [Catellatospora citrea]|uniref:LysR family transcriptional regulator n=1 Tax=Catellatospora citrea TaxID=53366 RepID=A0A8J3K8E6_9ACTN|nr:LysR family transcriptional regulator [Catellatospora citrea]RKE12731.1 DNA-binding transcriptional LysR family regulator [Catellatospora citrea]GIF96029.1 LysR family transcriptional regulator [Catellatospora citrea]